MLPFGSAPATSRKGFCIERGGEEGVPMDPLTTNGNGGCGFAVAVEIEDRMDSTQETYPIQTQNALHNSDVPAGGIGIGEKNGPTQTMRGDGKPPAVGIIDEPKYVVRRITPMEAERLQGFPDGWTDVEFRGKPAPDTARYKALGNSMTVNVMRWIAKRILIVEKGDL